MTPRTFRTIEGLQGFFMRKGAGRAFCVALMHDSACSPSRCVCAPWFRVSDLTAENVMDAAQQQAQWIRKASS